MTAAVVVLDEADIARRAERARLRGLAQECRNVAALFAGDGDHFTAGDCLTKAADLESRARALRSDPR